MNKSEGLVPTRVVNKNGVATTVHKRLPSTLEPSTLMPAPVVSHAKMTRPEKIDGLVQRISEVAGLDKEQLVFAESRMYLFGDRSLAKMQAAFNSSDAVTQGLASLLVRDEDYDIVIMSARFMPDMEAESLPHVPSLLRGLQWYRDLPHHPNYTEVNSVIQSQVSGLLRVAYAVEKNHGKSFFEDPVAFPVETRTLEGESCKYIKDQNLVRLVMRRSDDVDAIIGVLEERGSISAQMIEALLDGADPAFASGSL